MCRWIAYDGPPIFLADLIFRPRNSLASQSLRAREGIPTNGDGFGVGWYSEKPEPGVFKDILPAWNDENLRSVSEQIRSHLFFAHVRASTGTATARTNCHPFRWGKWMFMHNGKVGGFEKLRRDMAMAVEAELFSSIRGTTDSELFFHLMLTNGLARGAEPEEAFAATVEQVTGMMARVGTEDPFRMTAALTDGQSVYALRYASDDQAPTLYYGCGVAVDGDGGPLFRDGEQSILVISEPLDDDSLHWIAVPQRRLLTAGDGAVSVTPFLN